MVTLRVFVFTFLTSWLAIAQNPDVHLRGTVETARSAIDLVLELRSARGPADGMSAIPGLAGHFDFPRLQPGLYVLTVKNHRDEILKSDYVSVGASDADVTIRLGDAQPVEGRGTVT